MTCIVGLVRDGTVYLGGDSAAMDAWYHSTPIATPKVFMRGIESQYGIPKHLALGYTSSFRLGQLLQHTLALPAWAYGDTSETWLVAKFIPALRTCLTEGGYTKKENNREEGGQFLVGLAGQLFCVQDDFAVLESSDGYNAVGCGAAFALGSLHATRRHSDPYKRLDAALKAAEHHSGGVRGPFDLIKVQ
jgi:hypothetical protein